MEKDMTAYEFVLKNIEKTTKNINKKSNDNTLIDLPFPYTTPCASKMFQEMYYWDTYFTQKCLYHLNLTNQAKNNILNFKFLLEKYGKIPNGNRTYFLSRSQPPFFGLMLKDYEEFGDNSILKEEMYNCLKIEYDFWQKDRFTKSGLNSYNTDMSDEQCKKETYVELYFNRTGIVIENNSENNRHIQAECESGWDFSPRFDSKCSSYNPVDLNCLLYADEILLSKWAGELNKNKEKEYYINKADKRKNDIKTLMLYNDIYYDYNFKTNTRSKVISCASLFPFYVGIDTNKERFKKILSFLEKDYGVIACLCDKNNYQWSQPNSWAPLNYIAIYSSKKLGLNKEAIRLTDKYISSIDSIFNKNGRLWEKYNAEKGNMEVLSEYGTPEMLGWTAGVYIALLKYKENGYTNLI